MHEHVIELVNRPTLVSLNCKGSIEDDAGKKKG
jgi:hypothetical protein